jgi:GH25 family lysozyme M1 (1,4-beta-N-acetylmuramidase)
MADLSPLLVDYFQGDHAPDLSAVSSDPRYAGAIIKATQGTHYNGKGWFAPQWASIHDQSGYGDTWFRGCYHFLNFNEDGAAQADYYLKTVQDAGGWDHGDLWPIVDVERGREDNPNQKATAEQVIACTKNFVAQVKAVTNRPVMLYGNGAMRDLKIRDRMGCDWMWCPRYTATLPAFIYERAGWSIDQLVMWQYSGDGKGVLANYPTATPDGKKIDHSALVLRGGVAALRSLLSMAAAA